MTEQASNIFNKGLQLDTNPLVQSNETMSDALNATFVTMNGDEVILQNDMGNRRIEDAYLPPGYEPVGIKEHGGIIYIAAYNPITNRSQLGSFPSPERKLNARLIHLNDSDDGLSLGFDILNIISSLVGNTKSFSEILSVDNVNQLTNKYYFLDLDSIIQVYNKYPLHIGDKFSLYGNYSDFIEQGTKVSVISGFYNTVENKIYSPKKHIFDMNIGVLNSQNNFVDITKSLIRWNGVSQIEFPELLDYQKGSFIQSSNMHNDLTEADENFEENRNTILANTYNNKLVGPLAVKLSVNHFEQFSYSVRVSWIDEEETDPASLIAASNIQTGYLAPNQSIVSIANQYESSADIYKAQQEYEEALIKNSIKKENNLYDFMESTIRNPQANFSIGEYNSLLSSFNVALSDDKYYTFNTSNNLSNFDAYDVFWVKEDGSCEKLTNYQQSNAVIQYDKDLNKYTCKFARTYRVHDTDNIINKNETVFKYIVAPKLINNLGVPFGGTTSSTNFEPNGGYLQLIIDVTIVYNSPDGLPNRLVYSNSGRNGNVDIQFANPIYLSNLCKYGFLDLSKLGNGQLEVLNWQFSNNIEQNKTDIKLSYIYYEDSTYPMRNFEILLENDEGNYHVIYSNENGPLTLNINLTVNWTDDSSEQSVFNPSTNTTTVYLSKRNIYKVKFVADVMDSNNLTTVVENDKLLLDGYWIMTTTLFNDSVSSLSNKYINNFCYPASQYQDIYESLKEVKLTYTTPEFDINLNNVDIQRESNMDNFIAIGADNAKIESSIEVSLSKSEISLSTSNALTIDLDKYPIYIDTEDTLSKDDITNVSISVNGDLPWSQSSEDTSGNLINFKLNFKNEDPLSLAGITFHNLFKKLDEVLSNSIYKATSNSDKSVLTMNWDDTNESGLDNGWNRALYRVKIIGSISLDHTTSKTIQKDGYGEETMTASDFYTKKTFTYRQYPIVFSGGRTVEDSKFKAAATYMYGAYGYGSLRESLNGIQNMNPHIFDKHTPMVWGIRYNRCVYNNYEGGSNYQIHMYSDDDYTPLWALVAYFRGDSKLVLANKIIGLIKRNRYLSSDESFASDNFISDDIVTIKDAIRYKFGNWNSNWMIFTPNTKTFTPADNLYMANNPYIINNEETITPTITLDINVNKEIQTNTNYANHMYFPFKEQSPVKIDDCVLNFSGSQLSIPLYVTGVNATDFDRWLASDIRSAAELETKGNSVSSNDDSVIFARKYLNNFFILNNKFYPNLDPLKYYYIYNNELCLGYTKNKNFIVKYSEDIYGDNSIGNSIYSIGDSTYSLGTGNSESGLSGLNPYKALPIGQIIPVSSVNSWNDNYDNLIFNDKYLTEGLTKIDIYYGSYMMPATEARLRKIR